MSRKIAPDHITTWWVVGHRRPPWWASRAYRDMRMRREEYERNALQSGLALRRNLWRLRGEDPCTSLAMSFAAFVAAWRACHISGSVLRELMHADGVVQP